jgi:co-chaperonin GroES (HSP10)
MLALKPLPGRILVELVDKYTHVATTEQKYDTNTAGICIKVHTLGTESYEDRYFEIPGKLVFFEEYKAHATIERDGKKYAFVKIEDLDGYEDVETN